MKCLNEYRDIYHVSWYSLPYISSYFCCSPMLYSYIEQLAILIPVTILSLEFGCYVADGCHGVFCNIVVKIGLVLRDQESWCISTAWCCYWLSMVSTVCWEFSFCVLSFSRSSIISHLIWLACESHVNVLGSTSFLSLCSAEVERTMCLVVVTLKLPFTVIGAEVMNWSVFALSG